MFCTLECSRRLSPKFVETGRSRTARGAPTCLSLFSNTYPILKSLFRLKEKKRMIICSEGSRGGREYSGTFLNACKNDRPSF